MVKGYWVLILGAALILAVVIALTIKGDRDDLYERLYPEYDAVSLLEGAAIAERAFIRAAQASESGDTALYRTTIENYRAWADSLRKAANE